MQRKTIIYIMLSFILGSALTAFSASTLPSVYHLLDQVYVKTGPNSYSSLADYFSFHANRMVFKKEPYFNNQKMATEDYVTTTCVNSAGDTMQGDLNMNRHNILNAQTITSVGDISSGGKIKGSWLCIGNDCKSSWSEVTSKISTVYCDFPEPSSSVLKVKPIDAQINNASKFLPLGENSVDVYTLHPVYEEKNPQRTYLYACPYNWDRSSSIYSIDEQPLGAVFFKLNNYVNRLYGKTIRGRLEFTDGVLDKTVYWWDRRVSRTSDDPVLWQADLGDIYNIDYLYYDLAFNFYEIRDTASIQSSKDGTTWTTLFATRDEDGVKYYTGVISNVTARYLRIVASNPYWLSPELYIFEIIAWDKIE